MLSAKIAASKKSVLLLGPRQVGKSTLIRSLKPEVGIDLAHEKTYLEFLSDPGELETYLTGKTKSVFVDEVQRLPSLLNTVQALIDGRRPSGPKFYLTGSSARKLRRGQANLLPGRVHSFQLGPLCPAELGYKMETARLLVHGSLPEVYLEKDRADRTKLLDSYASTYLREEIQAEALTRNLPGFARFLQAAAESAGQYVDITKLAKKAKVERKTCARSFDILEDTLVGYRVGSFPKEGLDLVRHPKFFFFDNGVLNSLLGSHEISADRRGFLFEHAFLAQWVASHHARDLPWKAWNFRTRGGLEADFVLEHQGQRLVVELKHSSFDAQDAEKLEKVAASVGGKVKRYVLLADDSYRARNVGGTAVLPWQVFFRELGL